MSFEFDEDLLVGDMPYMAQVETNQWVDIAFKLKSVRTEQMEKSWNIKKGDTSKVHFVEMMHEGSEDKWHEEEIPFWTVKLFMDFASEYGNKKGDLKCKYMRTEVWNKKDERMDSKGKFSVED